jgi:hypothetical protein
MTEKKDLENDGKPPAQDSAAQVAPKEQEDGLPRRREVFEALEKVFKKPQ